MARSSYPQGVPSLEQRDSNLHEQNMNPVFKHSNRVSAEDYGDEKPGRQSQPRSQLQSSQTGRRSN